MPQHVALATGADHGIGAATSQALAAAGCAVVCAYWPVKDPVDPAVPDAYRRSRARTADPVVEASREAGTWRRQFAVDAMAPALLIAEFARRHAARGATWGRIIGLTSGDELGFPQEVSYGAAKAAQTNYTPSTLPRGGAFGGGRGDRPPGVGGIGADHRQRHPSSLI
ncbi:hypothetical protein [Actinoplanes sp. NPDC049681]|uniref:hypothetical protein n=1 Tax=Actinoplanes sp. NPDC049681 TaxID=3363905 RepID=UPI0037947978